jgi:very-short-patch-repair endonuclease
MKRAAYPLSALKSSKVAELNKEVIEELENPKSRKKRVPSQPCKQVLWMGGQLAWWAREKGIEVVNEYRFHPIRRWKADFAVPDKKIILEYEGINSKKSRHTTLTGYTGDTEKYNAAQALGWKVLRFTALNYRTVLKELEKNIEQ